MKVFLDMDGVLCDFVGGACAVHGHPDHKVTHWNFFEDWGLTEDEFWQPINDAGEDFWADLKPYPWAEILVGMVEEIDPNFTILTTPSRHESCNAGKAAWLKRHFENRIPSLLFAKDKARHCLGSDCILIDDSDKNIDAWHEAGGYAIPYPQPWNKAPKSQGPLNFVEDKLRQVGRAVLTEGETITNDKGGKQSFIAARLDLIPPENQLLLGECLGFGARKYGENNWQNIPIEDNLNHLMVHATKWLAGDRSEPHLVNILARGNFALWHAIQSGDQPKEYIHPDMLKD